MDVTIHRKNVINTELNTGTEINSLIGLYLANLPYALVRFIEKAMGNIRIKS